MNVVDSSGWLEYFADGSNADFYAPVITDEPHLIVPTICMYEVFKRLSINEVKRRQSAIDAHPYLAMLHMELGQTLRLVQVYEDAIKEFTLANTLDPGDPEPDYLISRTYGTTGEYEKALQYAETAVKDGPTDPRYRGNYGVMFYRNFRYQQAVEQLSLAIDGGTNEDGFPVKPIALNDDPRIAEFFFTYGLALARTNNCGKALPIAQTLQTRFPAEDELNAVIVEAADSIIQICQENLENPPETTPTEESTTTPEATDTHMFF